MLFSIVNNIYHMGAVLSLLSVLFNHDNLTLKFHQKSYLNKVWLFIGRFKVRSLPGMINKEELA